MMATRRPLDEEFLTDADADNLNQGNFDYVRFTFADINGVSRSKTIPKEHVKDFLPNGISLFAGSIAFGNRDEIFPLEEIKETKFGNALVRPLPGTLHPLPWASSDDKMKIGEFICETFWMKPYRNGGHQTACPRFAARRQLDRLFDLGYNLYSTFEAEFFLLHKVHQTPIFNIPGMFSSNLMDRHGPFLYEMESNLRQSGVDVLSLQTEYGKGQFELALQPLYGISAADQMFQLKDGIKAIAHQHDFVATFMTRPLPSDVSSGLHCNHSLWSVDTGMNAFHDSLESCGLSKVAKSWITGLIKHAPAIAALCSPTVNCYRRLHSPFAPSMSNWGIEDRCSTFRIKNHSPKETYVENRLASNSANPYLVLAATVAAGIDGLINRLDCPPPEQMDEAVPLPKSLEQSLKCLEEDEVITAALGEEFIRWFSTIKREYEISKMKDMVSESDEAFDREKELYFECI